MGKVMLGTANGVLGPAAVPGNAQPASAPTAALAEVPIRLRLSIYSPQLNEAPFGWRRQGGRFRR